MTNIVLHGILAKEFGNKLTLEIDNIKTVIDAIDANRDGFLKKLNELSGIGLNYCLVVDGKMIKDQSQVNRNQTPEQIDFVPIVCGQGVVLAAVGVGLLVAGSSAFLGITALSVIGGVFLSTGLSMLLAPKPNYPEPPSAERSVTGLERSFAFANKANVAYQGVSIPIGYGRLRVGSYVVQGCVKTYPQNVTSQEGMESNPYEISNIARSNSEILSP